MCHPVECVEFCGCASCFPPSGAPPFYLFSLLRDIKALPVAPSRQNPESFWPLGRNLEVFISSFIITYGRRFISCFFVFFSIRSQHVSPGNVKVV